MVKGSLENALAEVASNCNNEMIDNTHYFDFRSNIFRNKMDEKFNILEGGVLHTDSIKPPKLPISKISIGSNDGYSLEIGVDKKFNWFQKKMIKWCFGFEVKENKNNGE